MAYVQHRCVICHAAGKVATAAATSLRGFSDGQLAQQVARGFDCCILCAPSSRPEALLDKALPLLAPSAAFVVYSMWSQPLAEALSKLQVSLRSCLDAAMSLPAADVVPAARHDDAVSRAAANPASSLLSCYARRTLQNATADTWVSHNKNDLRMPRRPSKPSPSSCRRAG